MKISRVYIENFGKFHMFSYDFAPSMNEIVEDNGWGKTTLAVFIKAMFYGLSKSSTKVSGNERKKYMPWQGGNMGGYIEFEAGGNAYRIERFFGKKESEDSFKLINLKTGKEERTASDKIGEELFGLDGEGYERSTFIPQKELPTGINESISSKLINMVQGTDSKDSYENALEILEEGRKQLKKQGNTGKIAQTEAQLTQVLERIDELKKEGQAIDTLQQGLREIDADIAQLEQNRAALNEKLTAYGSLKEKIAGRKYFEENVAKKEEIEASLQKYRHILNDNKPNDGQLDDVTQNIRSFEEKKVSLQTLRDNNSSRRRLEGLKEFFTHYTPTEEEVVEQIKAAERLKILKESPLAGQKPQKKTKIYAILPLLLGICAIVAGCVLISKYQIPAIIALIAGVVALLLSGFLYFKGYIEQKTGGEHFIDAKSKNEEIEALERKINAFLANFDVKSQNDPQILYDIRSKMTELKKAEEDVRECDRAAEGLADEIEVLKGRLDNFFASYNLQSPSYSERLNEIKWAIKEQKNLLEQLENVNEKLKKLGDASPEEVEDVDISDIQAEFDSLQKTLDERREERSRQVRQIDDIRGQLAALDELENLRDNLIEEIDGLKAQLNTIVLTKEFLTRANDNLSSKYLKPMSEGLNKYLKIILADNYQKLNIDTDFNVSLEMGGQSREIDYLSKGYQGVIDLCIRFALLDCLFTKEKPFLILDDPFVNMDKDKLENATRLICQVSGEYQLVYLICHPSRSVGPLTTKNIN